VLITNEQAMSEDNGGWMDGFVQSGIQKHNKGGSMVLQSGVASMKQSVRAIPNISLIVCAWQMTSGLRNRLIG
jgi:hypothetical protein